MQKFNDVFSCGCEYKKRIAHRVLRKGTVELEWTEPSTGEICNAKSAVEFKAAVDVLEKSFNGGAYGDD